MKIPAAFLGVILVWSTTPLAIKWSGEGSHFLFGVTVRMAIGGVLCLALAAGRRIPIPLHRDALRVYAASGLGIFGGMTCAYWGALHIPSGWLSVIFGLTPIFTGLMAWLWLGERMTVARLVGMVFGFGGLLILFGKGAAFGPYALAGIGAVVAASAIQSASAVWVKRLDSKLPILAVTAGGVCLAAVLDGVLWAVSGLGWPDEVTSRAAWSILYLGVGGSVLGFLLYFYLLRHVEATKTALITLITPVSALLLGRLLNSEPLTPAVLWGTAAILGGLLVFRFGDRRG